MSNTLKGVLFSALIFPGAGQIILSRYRRGAFFFALAFVSGIFSVIMVVRQAVLMLQDLVSTGASATIPKVMEIVMQASTTASTLLTQVSFLLLLGCWLVSVVDAYRIGKELDQRPADV
jgi:TM2 domain-containing membrane protein YozV